MRLFVRFIEKLEHILKATVKMNHHHGERRYGFIHFVMCHKNIIVITKLNIASTS